MKITASFMSLLGSLAAGITVVLGMLPADAPLWLNIALTGIGATLSAFVGVTSGGGAVPGTLSESREK